MSDILSVKPMPRDISFYLPDVDTVIPTRKCYNYRLSYRLSIASSGKPTYNAMHGSSIVRKKPEKESEPTYQELYDDAHSCHFYCNMWNRNFFIYPDTLLDIFDNEWYPSNEFIIDDSEPKEFEMSLRTKSKIKDKMYSLYRARMRNYTFCTLTFINKVDDKTSQVVLNKFFTQLRKKYPKFHYIWIAERQDGKRNGYEHCTNNVHFHIFFDRFFPIEKLNKYWVLMQYNSGIEYPTISKETILKHYENGTLQKLLNPVDVKKVNGLSGLTSYLTKYVTKNETKFNCRVWHCSRGISRLFTSCAVNRSVFSRAGCTSLNRVIDKDTGEVFERKSFITDHAVVYTIVNKRYFLNYMKQMEFINSKILDGYHYPPEGFHLDLFTALQTSYN